MEVLSTACQYLMSCSLMSNIPNYAVVWCIEDIMQGNGQFNHTKRTGKMAWVVGHCLYNLMPEFVADLRQ